MTTFLNTIAILFFAFAILSFIFNEAEKKTLETEKSPRVQKEIYQSVVVEEHIGKQSYPSQDTFESDTEYNSNMSYSLNSDLMNEFRNRMGLKKEQNIVMDNKNILSKKIGNI